MSGLSKLHDIITEKKYLFDDRELNDLKDEKVTNSKIKYTTIKNDYVTKEQAVAIAGCDRNLKDSIYKEWKENKQFLGWISFEEFDVALVQIGLDFAWHVKVKSGSFGGCEFKKILGITYKEFLFDGEFTEDSDISCIVMCNSGQYYYSKDIDMSQLKAPNMDEYKNYIKRDSIYHI